MRKYNQYSDNFKESLVKKSFLIKDLNIRQFCIEYNIAHSTFIGWRNKYIKEHGVGTSMNKNILNFTDKEKLEFLFEVKSKSNDNLGLFLREKGITEAQLKLWEQELVDIIDMKESRKTLSKAKKRIIELEKDLRKKDKALAEASALLILKKKADLIWGKAEE